jgi:hypothetical protein
MKKLKLDTLKVKSFVTALEEEKAHTVKGGASTIDSPCFETLKRCIESVDNVCIPRTEYQSCICEM